MDKETLIRLLQALDERLSRPSQVVIIGGAAMILHFGASRATQDVDAVLLSGEQSELRDAIRAVAQENGLPEDWMSDAVKGFAGILPPDYQLRLTLLALPLRNLQLYALGLPEQVAMKIVALRERDLQDLDVLLPMMSEDDRRTVVHIMHHVSRFRPDWALKIQLFLEEQGWKTD
jgi:predicted nucleotidyltransferase